MAEETDQIRHISQNTDDGQGVVGGEQQAPWLHISSLSAVACACPQVTWDWFLLPLIILVHTCPHYFPPANTVCG